MLRPSLMLAWNTCESVCSCVSNSLVNVLYMCVMTTLVARLWVFFSNLAWRMTRRVRTIFHIIFGIYVAVVMTINLIYTVHVADSGHVCTLRLSRHRLPSALSDLRG